MGDGADTGERNTYGDLPRRTWTEALIGILAIAVLVTGVLFLNERFGWPVLAAKPPPAPTDGTLPRQTEVLFLNSLKNEPASDHEWWTARSDHRLVAHGIFHCKQPSDITADAMPREYFTALLLDLTPDGNHLFRKKETKGSAASNPVNPATSEPESATETRKFSPLLLTGTDLDLLSLSDSIARTRIDAAASATASRPWTQWLGIATLIVSALATLFVTLQGKMKPPPAEAEVKLDPNLKWQNWGRVRVTLWGPGSGFRWVAFWAITLSITTTALSGLKQVYDPSRVLTQNTRALLELRQLHQDVILGFKCEDKVIQPPARLTLWTDAVRRLRGLVIPEYAAYANLDAGVAQRSDLTTQSTLSPPDTRARPASPPAPQPPATASSGNAPAAAGAPASPR
jgi:hypothetical protein